MAKNEDLTKEQKEMYIANCQCCLLAEAMKVCHICRFNIGLEARKQRLAELEQIAKQNSENAS